VVVTGVALVGMAGLSCLLGPSAGAATPGATSVRGATPARTACNHTHVSKPWSFGVEADTQWVALANGQTDDGHNPNTASIAIAKQLDQQFVNKGVKFVVEVGDLCDNGTLAGEETRAVFAQDLYDAGVGFYPLSGNHDDGDGGVLTPLYPQTQTAMMNETPASAFLASNPDVLTQPFPMQSGKPFQVGTISTSPAAPTGFAGLDYAVDYRNARLVFLDQFTSPVANSPAHEVLTDADVAWMNGQLKGRPAGTQAFVFGHKGIITQNHVDTLFGSDPTANPSLQDTFISDLQSNGVHYYIGGHDHMYNRAVVSSPDGTSSVQDIVSQSDANKFYIPFGSKGYFSRSVDSSGKVTSSATTTASAPVMLANADPTQTNDNIYDVQVATAKGLTGAGKSFTGKPRETQISQDPYKVGYFIVTVDGPNVTVKYYAASVNPTPTLTSSTTTTTPPTNSFTIEDLLSTTPQMKFVRAETFGYSLNGKEFFVPQGKSFTSVADKFDGTTAKILGGTNGSTATDAAGRAFTKDVDTGWTNADGRRLGSNVLTLWGMADLGATRTDTYTLAMSSSAFHGRDRCRGYQDDRGILVTRSDGRWVNAVDTNVGGTPHFVRGPWKASYSLGTYGVDPGTRTAWAVVDHAGKFAIAR
jgi:Calcineurin-like phosphoesterase